MHGVLGYIVLVGGRQEEAERTERIRQDVKEIQKVFYCELCNKQYKLASEFETHLSSYDHNHKKVSAATLLDHNLVVIRR